MDEAVGQIFAGLFFITLIFALTFWLRLGAAKDSVRRAESELEIVKKQLATALLEIKSLRREGVITKPVIELKYESKLQPTVDPWEVTRARMVEAELRQELEKLDATTHEIWTFNYLPGRIEDLLSQLEGLAPKSELLNAVNQRLPEIRLKARSRYVMGRIKEISNKTAKAATFKTRQRYATEALQLLDEPTSVEAIAPDEQARLKSVITHYIAQVEIDAHIDKAHRFEFKDNKKKALEYYKEALYAATHDNIDDIDQKEVIEWLQAKITAIETGQENTDLDDRPKALEGFL